MSQNIELDFNKPFLDLNGNEVQEDKDKSQKLSRLLAAALSSTNQGNAIKYTDWSIDLWKGKSITVDNSDKNEIKQFITNTKGLTNLMKRQMIDVIKESEEKELKIVDDKKTNNN